VFKKTKCDIQETIQVRYNCIVKARAVLLATPDLLDAQQRRDRRQRVPARRPPNPSITTGVAAVSGVFSWSCFTTFCLNQHFRNDTKMLT